MDIAEVYLVQDKDGNVVLSAAGKAIIGVDSLSMGGDDRGSFMDVRFRTFGIGAAGQRDDDEDDDAREPERSEG